MIQRIARKSSNRAAISVVLVQLMALFLLCFGASAAEVMETQGTVKGVSEQTQVGAVPSQSGPRAEADRPFSTSGERKPANILMHEDIAYVVKEKSKAPGKDLVLDCTIDKMADKTVLSRLAEKIYMSHSGKNYDNVTIFWHLGMNPEPAKPWGRTDISKMNVAYDIVTIQ